MTGNRNLLAILVCALAVTSAALGQSGPGSPNSSPGFHVTGILPTRDHPAAAPAQQPASNAANVPFNGIVYNGGPVMNSPHGTNVYYIWYGDWSKDPAAQKILTDFITDIGGTPYFNINASYYDFDKDGEKDPVRNKVNFKGSIMDNYSFGNPISANDTGAIVQNSVTSGKLPADADGVYFVLTSADVVVPDFGGFCTAYCAFHGYQPVALHNVHNLVTGFVGNPAAQCPNACAQESQLPTPNDNVGADAMVSLIAHELSESVTDPLGTGWINADGTENGDPCFFVFGNTKPLPNGSYYNVTLGKRKYLSQQIWVNRRGGYCAMAWGGDQ
jgi:hypothetical protein